MRVPGRGLITERQHVLEAYADFWEDLGQPKDLGNQTPPRETPGQVSGETPPDLMDFVNDVEYEDIQRKNETASDFITARVDEREVAQCISHTGIKACNPLDTVEVSPEADF